MLDKSSKFHNLHAFPRYRVPFFETPASAIYAAPPQRYCHGAFLVHNIWVIDRRANFMLGWVIGLGVFPIFRQCKTDAGVPL